MGVYLPAQMVIYYSSQLLAASVSLLVTVLVPIAPCGQVRSLPTSHPLAGASTSIQTSSTAAAPIVAAVFLFVVSQRINIHNNNKSIKHIKPQQTGQHMQTEFKQSLNNHQHYLFITKLPTFCR